MSIKEITFVKETLFVYVMPKHPRFIHEYIHTITNSNIRSTGACKMTCDCIIQGEIATPHIVIKQLLGITNEE